MAVSFGAQGRQKKDVIFRCLCWLSKRGTACVGIRRCVVQGMILTSSNDSNTCIMNF